MTSPFGLSFALINCPLSESSLHSDSALLSFPAPVPITSPFGLPFSLINCPLSESSLHSDSALLSLAYSCPNHLLIRTLLCLVFPAPVPMSTPFGLSFALINCPLSKSSLHSDSALLSLACFCPNHLLIRTLLCLVFPAPVPMTSSFGLSFARIDCPLSESSPHSDSPSL